MSVDLTRQELYDLVWSMPMTHAAKKFGISDVMLGRICAERHIPKPQRGYWASIQSQSKKGRDKFIKPPLPNMPEPDKSFDSFMSQEYKAREASRTDVFDPSDLNDPVRPPPPAFTETLEEFRTRIEAVFPKLTEPSELINLHPIVQKVLDQDLIVAAKRKRDRYAPDPRYQDEKGKMYLQLLNLFIHNFELLGFDVRLQGRIHFVFHASLLKHHREFHVFVRDHDPSAFMRKRFNEKKRRTYCFAWSREYEMNSRGNMYEEFEELNADCVKQVVMDLVMKDEADYRRYVFRDYESNVESRKRAIEYRDLQIQRAAEKKRKALAQLLENREQLMHEAVASMIHADKIRELIATMQAKADATGSKIKGMKRWVGWATHHANTIDPRSRSLEGFEVWLDKFKLKH